MKRKILFLFICGIYCLGIYAQSFRIDFIMALNTKDMQKAEDILKAWDLTDANDPELYVAFFNFYTVKSMDAGMLATSGYDTKYSKQALEFISEGIERFPTRLDMRIAKIFMLGELKAYQDYVAEVIALIIYSDKIKNNWREEGYMSVEYPEDMFFGIVADCQEFLFAKEDVSLFKGILRISDEMIKYYPDYWQSRLAASTIYIAQKEFDKSLQALLQAEKLEPEDAIILYNIAYVYRSKGDKANAKKYYELTIKHCKEKEEKLKEEAAKQLEELQ